MTIKKKVQFIALGVLLCIVAIAGVFVLRNLSVQVAEARLDKISSVVRGAANLYAISDRFISNPSTETSAQWQDEYQKITETLDSPSFEAYKDKEQFLQLRRHNNTIGALFIQMKNATGDTHLRARFSEQILHHTNEFVQDSAALASIIFTETEVIRRQTTVGFFISLEILFAIVVSFVVLMVRNVTNPLMKLTDVVLRMGKGDFSLRAPSRTKDEIGSLGAAFNEMEDKLQKRTKDLEEAKANDEKLLEDLNSRVAQLEDARKAMTNLFQDFEDERAQLMEAKAKDEALLENLGEGVMAVDKDKRIILVNRVAENLLGIQRENVLGKKYYEVFGNQDVEGKIVEEPNRPITKVLESGKKISTPVGPFAPYYYIRSDGTRFPVAITVTPVILGGETVGVIDIFRDVTREKEIEKLRIDFLALASHQLRTPLSGTKWLIETIRRGVTGEVSKKQQEYLEQIYQTNERMIALVYDMLDVLKIESGETAVKKKNFSPHELYNDLEVLTEPVIKKRGVIMRNVLPADSKISAFTDFDILKGILEEYISNAAEYTPDGKEIVFDAQEKDGSIVFSVKDNGIGVPKDEHDKIFQRFYRASNAKEFRPDGTGLGLYRASLLAEKINARLWIESDTGKGATFFASIPQTTN